MVTQDYLFMVVLIICVVCVMYGGGGHSWRH